MSIVDASIELFSQRLDSQEGKDKVAALGQSFIRDRLREVNYTQAIIPPEHLGRKDCQRSVHHDTLIKVVDVEPESRAMPITFRGEPTARFIRGPRAEIPFFTISSEKFEKTEEELMAYEMPLTKVIEDNSVKDIDEIKDREFTRHIESAVQGRQTEGNPNPATPYNTSTVTGGTAFPVSVIKGELALSAATDDFVVRPLQRPDLVNLFKLLDSRRLRADKVLMTEPDWDDILQWTIDDNGDRIQSETVVEGYKYNTILGRRVVRTIKTDILRPGNVYCFAAPEFLGKHYILNNLKFYIDKIANTIMWQSWMTIGMGIINISAVVKLELYSGSVRPTATDAGFEAGIPKAVEDLGAPNNRVDQGLHFPDVAQF